MQAQSPSAPPDGPRIGQRLLALVRERGWSLRKLATVSGVSPSQLSLLTRDLIRYPQISTMALICQALDVDVADLFARPPGTEGGRLAWEGGGLVWTGCRPVSGPPERAQPSPDFARRSHRWLTNLHANEGVTVVQVVALMGGGRFEATGASCAVGTGALTGCHDLYAAIIDGGGMAPDVLLRDCVVFEAVPPGDERQIVVLRHLAATIAAWRTVSCGVVMLWNNEGANLAEEDCEVVGPLLHVGRLPPTHARPDAPSPVPRT